MQIGNLKKTDLPGFALLMSILIFGLSAISFYGWKWEYQSRDNLYEVSGVVESFEVESVYKSGKKMMLQVTNHGVPHHLTQDDFTKSIPLLRTLRQGDEISTLVTSDVLGRDIEWIWEVRRGDEILLSYEQTLELRKPGAQERFLSIASLVVGIVLLLTAIKLRIKYRKWTS